MGTSTSVESVATEQGRIPNNDSRTLSKASNRPNGALRVPLDNAILPEELWKDIVKSLDKNEVVMLRFVCKYLYELASEMFRTRWKLPRGREIAAYSARQGYLRLLIWLKANGCPMSMSLCEAAACSSLEVVKWATDHGCPWTPMSWAAAAEAGRLDILKWAKSQDKPMPDFKIICERAALGGRVEILEWIRERTFSSQNLYEPNHIALAASGGHQGVIKFLRTQGVSWDASACRLAAANNHIELLKWLRENNCPWDKTVCDAAAATGQLDVLQWLVSSGCPWSSDAKDYATANQQQKVIDWINTCGLPSDIAKS